MRKTIKLAISLNIILIITISILIAVSTIKEPPKEKVQQEKIIIDKISPTIELIDSEITTQINTKIEEPGYIAKDNIDGDITSKVIITNNIDTTKPGIYYINYEVTDSSNNKTTTTRKVIIEKNKITRKKTYTNTKTSNKEINDKIKVINDYLSNYKVSVGYINMENGFTYIYNGNKEYFGASLIKVIDSMYIYENNLNDKETTELVKDAISISSNPAHASLVKKIGIKNYTNYMKKISNREVYCNERTFCQTTVHDQLSYWIYLYYLLEEHPDSEELKSFYINNLGNHLSYTQKFDNLHKYGASDEYYHDVGIFYEDEPYIIVVLTKEIGSYNKHIKYLIRGISREINILNDLVETHY